VLLNLPEHLNLHITCRASFSIKMLSGGSINRVSTAAEGVDLMLPVMQMQANRCKWPIDLLFQINFLTKQCWYLKIANSVKELAIYQHHHIVSKSLRPYVRFIETVKQLINYHIPYKRGQYTALWASFSYDSF
jgi:hypothetical protein